MNTTSSSTPSSSKRSRRPRTVTGSNAIARIARFSKDQVVGAVKARYTGPAAGANIARDMKTILSLVNTEDKQVYTLATTQAVQSTGSLVYGLGTMAQGTGGGQRIGDSIKINRIDLILNFSFASGTAATAAQANQTFNWYLVRYLKTPSSSGTVAFNISEFLNQDANGNYSVLSFPNTDTNENFQIMASGQQRIDLDVIPASSCTKSAVVTVSHPCSFHQDYTGSAATTIVNNMVFLVCTGLTTANTGGSSGVAIQSCMWFIDN